MIHDSGAGTVARLHDRMSVVRPPKVFDPTGKYPNARRVCCWCEKPVAYGRRRYCSNECQRSRLSWSSWAETRVYVFWRDHGRCVLCGVDCDMVTRIFNHLRAFFKSEPIKLAHVLSGGHQCLVGEVATWFAVEVHGWKKLGTSFWEVDHICPRESGGHNQPPNLRLLCQRCHRNVTAEYVALLAAGRKTTANPQLKFQLNEKPAGPRRKIPTRVYSNGKNYPPSRKIQSRPFKDRWK